MSKSSGVTFSTRNIETAWHFPTSTVQVMLTEFMEVHSLHRLVILMGLKKVKYCKFFIGARFYEKKINFCYLCNTCSGFHWFTTESSQPLTEKSWKMYNGWINNISSIKHGKITTIINIKINIRIQDGKSQCKNQYKY